MYGFAAVAVAAWLYAHSQNSVHELMSSAHWEILSRNKSHSCRHTDHKYSTNSANDIGVTQRFTFETLKWWEREEQKKIYASFAVAAATKTINYTELEWGDLFFREAIVQTYFHIVNECERKGIRIYHIWCCCWLHWPHQCTSTDNKTKN